MVYVIEGTVKKLNNLPEDGVQIKVFNIDTGETHKYGDSGWENLVTDEKGEYAVDMEDFDTYSAGQKVNVILGDGQWSKYERVAKTHTIGSGGGGTLNFDYIFRKKIGKSMSTDGFLMRSFRHGMVASKQDFFKKVNDADAVSLATTFANATSAGQFLEIPAGYSAYVTEVYVGADGTTDKVFLALAANSGSNGKGADNTVVTGEILYDSNLAGFGGQHLVFSQPVRVPYVADTSESVVMRFKGSGTTDDLVAWFKGYIIKEES